MSLATWPFSTRRQKVILYCLDEIIECRLKGSADKSVYATGRALGEQTFAVIEIVMGFNRSLSRFYSAANGL